ncbi:hypothetical protein [Deinococcus sonorensis]|uniref:Uncharacterized protein n=2 Tax=Deinococcus sonorensis TaxID=309891 RepID=A0AAU7U5E2_9DEIO
MCGDRDSGLCGEGRVPRPMRTHGAEEGTTSEVPLADMPLAQGLAVRSAAAVR